MTEQRDYHVVPSGKKWAVRKAGGERATSLHRTYVKAVVAGVRLAEKRSSTLFVHGKDGRIKDLVEFGRIKGLIEFCQKTS